MSFGEAVKSCLTKYVSFTGRASRSEYWWFVLFLVIVNLIAAIIDWQLFGSVKTSVQDGTTTVIATRTGSPVQSATGLLLFLPHLSAAWRRMQDTGRSGLYALLPILLILGAFAVLIFGIGVADVFASGGSMDKLFTRLTLLIVIPTIAVLVISPLLVLWWLTRPSQPGANRYGPNPHEVTT